MEQFEFFVTEGPEPLGLFNLNIEGSELNAPYIRPGPQVKASEPSS